MKSKTPLFLVIGIISATSFLAPSSAQEEPSQEYRRAKAISSDEAVQMLKRYGIIDPYTTGKFVSSIDSSMDVSEEYRENPIAAISEEFLYHFMMYNDGVENLSDYPYIDKIFESYQRANTRAYPGRERDTITRGWKRAA